MADTVLVTGATGRIGRLLRQAIDANEGLKGAYPTRSGATPVDVADADSLYRAIEIASPRYLVHLASLTGPACEVDPERTRQVNVESVRRLTAAAATVGAERIILASSGAVYGDQYHEPIPENAPLAGTSAYAQSKVRAEAALESGLGPRMSAVSLRIFNVVGRAFNDSLAYRLMHSDENDPVALFGMDSFVRDYVAATDVVAAIISAMATPLPAGHVPLNVGSGIAVSNRQLIDRLSLERELYFDVREAITSYSVADIAASRALLGFNPGDAFSSLDSW